MNTAYFSIYSEVQKRQSLVGHILVLQRCMLEWELLEFLTLTLVWSCVKSSCQMLSGEYRIQTPSTGTQ